MRFREYWCPFLPASTESITVSGGIPDIALSESYRPQTIVSDHRTELPPISPVGSAAGVLWRPRRAAQRGGKDHRPAHHCRPNRKLQNPQESQNLLPRYNNQLFSK